MEMIKITIAKETANKKFHQKHQRPFKVFLPFSGNLHDFCNVDFSERALSYACYSHQIRKA